MSDTETQTSAKAIDAKITEEDIERHKRQIGVSQHSRFPPFNRTASEDTIRHFAWGMVGDDNPLWSEPDYGATTRWRGQIASPLYAVTAGHNETPRPQTLEMKALFRGLHRGVGRYNVGTTWEMFKPIRPGDKIYEDMSVNDVQVKQSSSFSGARTVLERNRHLYINANGEPVAVRYEHFVNAERGGSKKSGRYDGVERQTYTPEEIQKINERYAAETRRGGEPRWWEDVEVGDELVPVIKGPLGMVEIICAHLGWGFSGTYGDGPLRFGAKNRMAVPAFYVEDKYGVPGSMQRVHWDPQRAQDLGLPTAYDYAQMRSNWMAHLVTNWMGDDAWISNYRTEARVFNFHGDTTLFTGRVAAKRTDGVRHLVDLDLRGTNQRNEAGMVGSATVLLPSRAAGPVILPPAGLDLSERGAKMMADAAERKKAGA